MLRVVVYHSYVALVLLGNKVMESQEPMALTGLKLVYNMTQVAL